jgi:pimeloyl-ACP methyl ester carboxylesterase
MATDIAGLLDTLGLDSVHVMGISMGGMIAQQFAVDYPAKVRSLTSIMSTTGNPHVGQPSQAAAEALLQLNATTREEAVAMATTVFGIIGSPGFPPDEDRLRRLAGEAFDRNHEPTGMSRQLGAILGSPDRTSRLAEVRVPAVVIHGSADPLVNLSGGEATAAAIAGAKLVIIDGMGHDLPEQVWDEILGEVDAIARTAEARGAAASSPSS